MRKHWVSVLNKLEDPSRRRKRERRFGINNDLSHVQKVLLTSHLMVITTILGVIELPEVLSQCNRPAIADRWAFIAPELPLVATVFPLVAVELPLVAAMFPLIAAGYPLSHRSFLFLHQSYLLLQQCFLLLQQDTSCRTGVTSCRSNVTSCRRCFSSYLSRLSLVEPGFPLYTVTTTWEREA